jgi:hypothetical protein
MAYKSSGKILMTCSFIEAINLTGKPIDVQRRVMEDTMRKLHDVFGLDMRENDEKKGVYYLINKLREDEIINKNYLITFLQTRESRNSFRLLASVA